MSTTAAPTYGTLLGGAVSSTEVQSQYLRNPAWMDEVLLKTKQAPSFQQLLNMLGLMQSGGTNLVNWFHLEKDVYVNKFGVNSAAQPAIGANQTLTVAQGWYNAHGNSIVYVGMILCYPDGTTGRITTVTRAANNDQIVVAPLSAPNQLPAVAQGTILIPMAPSVGEANTASTDFLVTDVMAYDHTTQVIDWATDVTDFYVAYDQNGRLTVDAQDLPAPWTNGMVKTWNSLQLTDWYKSKMAQWQATLLLNRRSGTGGPTSLADPRYLDGVVPFIDAGGNNFITPTGNLTLPDFELMAQAFEKAAHGATKHRILCGRSYWNKVNNLMLSLPGQDMRQGTGNTAYNLAFKNLNGVGGHDFEYAIVEEFTNPLTGLVDHGYADVAMFVPERSMADTITGKQVPLMRMVYQEAWAGMSGGVGSGMWKWTMRKGPAFVAPGESTTLDRNALEMRLTAIYGTDLRLPSYFAISR